MLQSVQEEEYVNPDPVPTLIDTLHVLTTALPNTLLTELEIEGVYIQEYHNRFTPYSLKLQFQYNTVHFVREIVGWLRNDQICINRLDIALDIPSPDPDSIRDTLRQQLIAPWYKKEFHVLENGNFYTKPQNQANTISVYSTRESKVTGEPCCHTESRLLNASACKREGIHTVGDIDRFDYVRFWRKYLNLRQPNPRKLFRLIKKRPDLGFIYRFRNADSISRCPAQVIKVLGHRHGFDWSRMLDKVDSGEYISRILPVVCQK